MIPKFRAWDKVKRSIILVSEIVYSSDLSYINRVTLDGRDHKMLYGSETRQEDDVVLMQSTGLYDKHGVEIFEGDIVNINHTFRNSMTGSGTLTLNKNFEVIFINGMFTRDGSSMGLGKDLKYLTVIGNVHQNPELLGE